MICSECSKENPAGTIFCMFCGKRLQKQKFCSKCGKECNSETLFCSGCGNKLSEDVQPQNFSFFCSGCGQKLEADESLCGEKVECPSCKQQIIVPALQQNQNLRQSRRYVGDIAGSSTRTSRESKDVNSERIHRPKAETARPYIDITGGSAPKRYNNSVDRTNPVSANSVPRIGRMGYFI